MEIIGDRYELRSEIRRGGFGVTWYGWDKSLDMPVAIKEFSDPDPEHRGKFLREARTLAQFSGLRGIVNVRDFLQTQDKVYMVMEYLDGEDLSTYVDKKGRLSFEETMRLLTPVMDVLAKLHAANMLHRGQIARLRFGLQYDQREPDPDDHGQARLRADRAVFGRGAAGSLDRCLFPVRDDL